MPTQAEILSKADEIDKDAEILAEAIEALQRRGASIGVVNALKTRRNEWWEQANEMRRRSGAWADGPNGTRVAMIDGQVHIHTVESEHHDGCPQ